MSVCQKIRRANREAAFSGSHLESQVQASDIKEELEIMQATDRTNEIMGRRFCVLS